MKKFIIFLILLLSFPKMFPITNQERYNHVTEIYQSLIDKGVHEHAAFELVNQKVAEKGWTGYATGDNKSYNNVDKFTDHIIEWHGRMYPNSLKATTFEEFYNGIVPKKGPKYNKYSSYKKHLLKIRKGVLSRINQYRQSKNKTLLK